MPLPAAGEIVDVRCKPPGKAWFGLDMALLLLKWPLRMEAVLRLLRATPGGRYCLSLILMALAIDAIMLPVPKLLSF